MNWPTRRRWAVLAVVAVLVAPAIGAVSGATAAGTGAAGDSPPAVDNSTLNNTTNATDDGTTTVNDTTDDATDATDDTTGDATNDTVDDTTDSVDDATDSTTDAVNNTTGSATGTTGDAVDDVTNATGTVAGTADDATNATTAAAVEVSLRGGRIAGSLLGAVDAELSTTDAVLGDAPTDTGSSTDGGADGPGDSAAVGDDATRGRAATAPLSGARDGSYADGSGTRPADPAGVSGVGVGLAAVLAGLLQTVAGAGAVSLDLAVAYAGIASAQPGGTVRSGLLGRDSLDRLHRFAVAFRYSRHDASDPLAHDGRRAVYEEIEATPGVYLSRVAERADVPLSTTRYHVRVLADENLVTSAKIRGKRRYFPVEPDDDSVELQSALSERATARVLEALADVGPIPVGRLADELDRDPSTVSHHLDRLADDGLVERERDGRAVMNRLAPAAERAFGGRSDAPASRVADD